jgi:hypothetical protein
MTDGKRWTVRDRYSHDIYLTQERWEHIIEPMNHPEMEDFEEELKETIQRGQRRQDILNPQKYRYSAHLIICLSTIPILSLLFSFALLTRMVRLCQTITL